MKLEFKRKKKFTKEGFQGNPNVGWEILLVLAFVLIVCASIFGFLLFSATSRELSFSGMAEGRNKLVDKKKLGEVLEIFTRRQEKSTEILSSPARFVDPSL